MQELSVARVSLAADPTNPVEKLLFETLMFFVNDLQNFLKATEDLALFESRILQSLETLKQL
jgi:hypothetical protein